ncbi:MAG: hypothetical protein M9955_20230 [Rhizobiaceae bacterium]|nr:hypothetical protein [Rhizobiaceae bacterium]
MAENKKGGASPASSPKHIAAGPSMVDDMPDVEFVRAEWLTIYDQGCSAGASTAHTSGKVIDRGACKS